MRRRLSLLMALALPLAGAACGHPNAADEVVPLHIDGVDVLVMESLPVQVTAVVTGTLPTACSTIEPVNQTRNGNVIDVLIEARTDPEQVCILILKQVTERVRLQGGFPPGQYVLRVNGVESRFQV